MNSRVVIEKEPKSLNINEEENSQIVKENSSSHESNENFDEGNGDIKKDIEVVEINVFTDNMLDLNIKAETDIHTEVREFQHDQIVQNNEIKKEAVTENGDDAFVSIERELDINIAENVCSYIKTEELILKVEDEDDMISKRNQAVSKIMHCEINKEREIHIEALPKADFHGKLENTSETSFDNVKTKCGISAKQKTVCDTGGNKMYACDFCFFSTNCKPSLNTHLVVQHEQGEQYECDQCDFITNYKSNIRGHVLRMHEPRSDKEFFCCELCDYKTVIKSYMVRHIRQRHVKRVRKRYQCDHCEFNTIHKTSINRHNKTLHENNKPYNCDLCDYRTGVNYLLVQHMINLHNKGGVKKYMCGDCDFKTLSKTALKYHITSLHLNKFIKRYACDLCNFVSARMGSLKRHVTMVHATKSEKK